MQSSPHLFNHTSPLGQRRKTPWALLFVASLAALLAGAFAGLFGGVAALVVTMFLIFSVWAVGDYRVGVMLAVFLIPLSGTRVMPHEILGLKGLNPLNFLILISIFSLFITRPFMRVPMLLPKVPRMCWVFIGMMVLAALYGALSVSKIPAYYQALQIVSYEGVPGYLRDVLLRPVLFLLLAYMLGLVVANTRRPLTVLIPLFLSAVLLPMLVMYLVAKSGLSGSMLASSRSRNLLSQLGIHANELGLLFNMGFALGLFVVFELRNAFLKWVLFGILGLLLVGVILTFSRGAFLGMITTICFVLFTARRFHLTAGVIVFTLIAGLLMPSAVVERASEGVASRNVGQISAGRVDAIWLPLLPEVAGSPLIGHGMSSILWSTPARTRAILPVGHPHSAYLGVALDYGLLGAVIIFLFYRHMWRYFRQLSQRYPDAAWRGYFKGGMACILLLLVQGITDDRFTPTFPQIFLWLTYGLAVGLSRRPEAQAVLTPAAPALSPAPH